MTSRKIEPLSPVITEELAKKLVSYYNTPFFVYSQTLLEQQADKALSFPNAYGLTVRYAMKANSNRNILKIFLNKGIHFDASSGYEAWRAIYSGIPPNKILLTSQQPECTEKDGMYVCSLTLEDLIKRGVNFNACSLNQLERYGNLFPNSEVSLRINPGIGSGHSNKTNTGGPSSSFGIWHEQIYEALKLAKKYSLQIIRLHTHIGSGHDPKVWEKVALMSLNSGKKFLDAGHDLRILNLGGGYKVARVNHEKSTDLQECGEAVKQSFINFAAETGRELHLEIEPGTFLVANQGCLITKIIDVKSTPKYNFIIVDSGMTENTRPSLYGAQHPITIIPQDKTKRKIKKYIVSGHECESGSIWTTAKNDPKSLEPRELLEAKIGDLLVVGGTGAYCSSMSTKNYNSFPEAAEILISKKRKPKMIRIRQTLEQMMENERDIL